jgi:hypothetical protein
MFWLTHFICDLFCLFSFIEIAIIFFIILSVFKFFIRFVWFIYIFLYID